MNFLINSIFTFKYSCIIDSVITPSAAISFMQMPDLINNLPDCKIYIIFLFIKMYRNAEIIHFWNPFSYSFQYFM